MEWTVFFKVLAHQARKLKLELSNCGIYGFEFNLQVAFLNRAPPKSGAPNERRGEWLTVSRMVILLNCRE